MKIIINNIFFKILLNVSPINKGNINIKGVIFKQIERDKKNIDLYLFSLCINAANKNKNTKIAKLPL
jgi:hypothetical protein